nr:hypothetical protein [Tanacetum cinerariifolium]
MATQKFGKVHNLVAFLSKPTESEGFEQTVDFLNANPIPYALTVNPTIYTLCIGQFWATIKVKTVTKELQLQALVDGKKVIITKSTVRRDLQLEDAKGVDCLTNAANFELLTLMRFVQVFLGKQLEGMSTHNRISITPSHTKKIFRNMRRVGKGVKTPRSDEDSLKLKELMELCTNLQNRVLDLENTKTNQALEIDSLKKRVDSSDEASLGEDTSKQERIMDDIDVDEGITLVNETAENRGRFNDQEDAKMLFDVANDLRGEEVFVSQEIPLKEISDVDEVNAVSTVTTTIATIDDITLAKALMAIKSTKPKVKGIVLQEPSKSRITITPTTTTTISSKKSYDKAKRVVEKRNRPPTRAQQRSIMCTYLKNMEGWKPKSLKNKSFANIQELFDKAIKRVNTFVDYMTELVVKSSKKAEAKVIEGSLKSVGEELKQENAKMQNMEDDKESAELKQCLEIIPEDGDDVTIDATHLSSKSPTNVDNKIHKEGKKNYFQIFRYDGNFQMYLTFSKMLKNFDREDLEVLWRLVKARFEKIKLVDYMNNLLLHNLKTMFEHHIKDNVWKNQQGLDKVLN